MANVRESAIVLAAETGSSPVEVAECTLTVLEVMAHVLPLPALQGIERGDATVTLPWPTLHQLLIEAALCGIRGKYRGEAEAMFAAKGEG